MTRTIIAIMALGALLATPLSAAQVKLSKSGICHAPGSGWYDKTTNFTPYDSIESCLQVGRLPRGAAPTPAAPSSSKEASSRIPSGRAAYDRDSQFGSWIDADGDCLNTRHELLAELSTGPVAYGSSRCYISRGRWNDPYTGRIFTEARDVDIDHMVPLKWAWEHGADSWPADKRIGFANDPMNLFVVHAGTNREKGADGPLDWLPPNQGYRCEYVLRFQRIALTYGLSFSPSETDRIRSLRGQLCGS